MLDIYALMVGAHHPYPERGGEWGQFCLVMVGNAVGSDAGHRTQGTLQSTLVEEIDAGCRGAATP